MEHLSTASEVMDKLGGIGPVARLTGRKYSAAANWRSFDKFPANTYLVITTALRDLGCDAPASLWNMVSEDQ